MNENINFSNLAKLFYCQEGGTKSYKICKSDKVRQVIDEFKDKKLKNRNGEIISNKKQAIAIALSQAQSVCKLNSIDIKKLIEKVNTDLNDLDKRLNLTNIIETKNAIEQLNKSDKTKRVYIFKKLLWNKIINMELSGESLNKNMWNEIKKIHNL